MTTEAPVTVLDRELYEKELEQLTIEFTERYGPGKLIKVNAWVWRPEQ